MNILYWLIQVKESGDFMTSRAKEYMKAVVEVLQHKYGMSEIEAYRAIKETFLYSSLLYYVDETIHDHVETNADFVYADYKEPQLKRM